jgi:hypothetical protein
MHSFIMLIHEVAPLTCINFLNVLLKCAFATNIFLEVAIIDWQILLMFY